MLVAVLFVGALSFTSCKKETTETTETETTIESDGEGTTTTDMEEVDETGAKDTMSVTTDTITVKKP